MTELEVWLYGIKENGSKKNNLKSLQWGLRQKHSGVERRKETNREDKDKEFEQEQKWGMQSSSNPGMAQF
jgi:hypothetical protein